MHARTQPEAHPYLARSLTHWPRFCTARVGISLSRSKPVETTHGETQCGNGAGWVTGDRRETGSLRAPIHTRTRDVIAPFPIAIFFRSHMHRRAELHALPANNSGLASHLSGGEVSRRAVADR